MRPNRTTGTRQSQHHPKTEQPHWTGTEDALNVVTKWMEREKDGEGVEREGREMERGRWRDGRREMERWKEGEVSPKALWMLT